MPTTNAPPPLAKTFVPQEQREIVSSAITVAASSSAIAGGAGSTLAVLTGFQCELDDVDLAEAEPLDWEFHPSRVAFGDNSRKFLMAAVFMNPLIFGVLALVVNGLALVWRVSHKVPWLEALGSVQSPGVLFVPYLFLLQGTSLVAARLLFFPKSTGLAVFAGATVLAACVASPVLVYHFVVRQIPARVKYMPDPRVTLAYDEFAGAIATSPAPQPLRHDPSKLLTGWKYTVYRFVFGDAVAVSVDETSFFAERWSHVCDPYRPKCAVFGCLEAGQMIAISLLSAWRPSSTSECNARNLILCLMLLAYVASLLFFWPFNANMDNLLASLVAFMMFASMLSMAFGIAVEADPESILFSGAGYVLIATAFLAFIKAIWDVGLYAFDLYIGRRSSVRILEKHCSSETRSLTASDGLENSIELRPAYSSNGDILFTEEQIFEATRDQGNPLIKKASNAMPPLISSASLLAPLSPVPTGRQLSLLPLAASPPKSPLLKSPLTRSPLARSPLATSPPSRVRSSLGDFDPSETTSPLGFSTKARRFNRQSPFSSENADADDHDWFTTSRTYRSLSSHPELLSSKSFRDPTKL
ncbi:hypothetical protein DIPPA_07922 [Diplonema papillatum]|nr:hypothetical protein DIPPA_07922 [Diplonema papillatum]